MMQDVHVKLNQDCHNTSGTQQEEDTSHRKIGFTFTEEIGVMLHLEHSFV
jgi:hypothetical protein